MIFWRVKPLDQILETAAKKSLKRQLGALQLTMLPSIVAILFTDLFDSLSTFIGVATASGLTDEQGRPINLRKGLIVDAVATATAGLAGSSPGTAYVESIAGIRMGGRTGRASVITAVCFVPCFFLGPLVAAVPGYATAAERASRWPSPRRTP